MSFTLSFQTTVSGLLASGGLKSGTDQSAEMANPTPVPAAQPATLTTRTSATSGTLTMTNSDHGITTGQRIDLYWNSGQCFGVTVGTVSGTSVPFTSVQGGSALPNALTAMTVGKPQSVDFSVTGDNVTAMICSRASAGVRCYFVFLQALNVLALAVLNQPGQVFLWDGTNNSTGPIGSGGGWPGARNPLAGTSPTTVWISHADTAAADNNLSCAVLKH